MLDFTRSRLSRQKRLFGPKNMERIASVELCIVGGGRNGSAFSTLAAYSGFNSFSFIDDDKVKVHNLNSTVPFFKKDIGRKKVDVLKDKLKSIDPSIKCNVFPHRAQDSRIENVLNSSHIVVDATDNIPTKKYLNAKVSENLKKGKEQKLLSLGSGAFVKDGDILLLGAQATLFERGGACLLCGPLDEEEKTNLSRVSFVIVNILASLLGIQILLSSLINYEKSNEKYNFILYDCLSQQVVKLSRIGREDCIYCRHLRGGRK